MKAVNGMFLPDIDTHIAEMILEGPIVDGRGTYQLKKYVAALPQVENRRHAVDVGGHVGLWSRIMAMDFERVTAFEPHPEHIACFRENLRGFDNVTLHEAAVGRKEGVSRIQITPVNTGNTHIARTGVECRMIRLDDMDLDPVDFLKIDVEGYEMEVLLGAEGTIIRNKPVIVIEQKPEHAERYGRGRWDAVERLLSLGMRQAAVMAGDHIMAW